MTGQSEDEIRRQEHGNLAAMIVALAIPLFLICPAVALLGQGGAG